MMPLEGEPELLLETSFNEHTPKLSPDDRWLAYVSNESGRDEIYVSPFPRGGKVQIDRGRHGAPVVPRRPGALLPEWREDDGGRHLRGAGVFSREAHPAVRGTL